MAEDLASRLGQRRSPLATELWNEAESLATCFRRWQSEKPGDEARLSAIQRLLQLQRRAMDYLSTPDTDSRSPRPSSRPSRPPSKR
jgi:hypothetical protein